MKDEPNTLIYPPPTNETPQAGVHIPFLQALITGLLAGMTVLSGFLWYFHTASPWAAGFAIFSVVTFYAWLTMLRRWESRLERLLGIDLNGSGKIGDDPQPLPPLKIIVEDDKGRDTQLVDVPQPQVERLRNLARAFLQEGREFNYKTIHYQLKHSRNEYDQDTRLLLDKHWAYYKNNKSPQQGMALTHKGTKVLQELLSPSPTPRE